MPTQTSVTHGIDQPMLPPLEWRFTYETRLNAATLPEDSRKAGLAQMSDATEYRASAEAAARLASQSEDGTYKATMLKIAQAWLEMADRHIRHRIAARRENFKTGGNFFIEWSVFNSTTSSADVPVARALFARPPGGDRFTVKQGSI
jgi:hypothetical protein